MKKLWLLLTLMIILIIGKTHPVLSFNILSLFPHPGVSHFRFFEPVLRELPKKGHDVTVVSHFPSKEKLENYTDLVLTGVPVLKDFIDLNKMKRPGVFEGFFLINDWGLESCEKTLKSDAIKYLLSAKKKFDVILIEQFNSDCMYAVAYLLNAPIIAMSSSAMLPWSYDRLGIPFDASYIPVIFEENSPKMNYAERLLNWLQYHSLNFLYKYINQRQTDALIQRYLKKSTIPSVVELQKDTSLMLLNQHYSLSGAKALPPNVIEVGGLQITKEKPIEPELKKILDEAINGIIYINWGSLIRSESLPENKRIAILKAIARFDNMTVVWKWEHEIMPNKPSNVIIRKWLPQREILCHPNVKVFMSHGGLLGISESTYCGVPIVVTPLIGDQYFNAKALEYRGIATILPFHSITEENAHRSFVTGLSSQLQKKMKIVSESFKNRPEDPLQLAIWWIEKVASTKGLQLAKSHAVSLPWYIYYGCDIYLTITIGILLLILIFIIILNFIIKKIIVNNSSIKKKIKKN